MSGQAQQRRHQHHGEQQAQCHAAHRNGGQAAIDHRAGAGIDGHRQRAQHAGERGDQDRAQALLQGLLQGIVQRGAFGLRFARLRDQQDGVVDHHAQ